MLFDDALGHAVDGDDLLTEFVHIPLHGAELLGTVSDAPPDAGGHGSNRLPHPAEEPGTLFLMRRQFLQNSKTDVQSKDYQDSCREELHRKRLSTLD